MSRRRELTAGTLVILLLSGCGSAGFGGLYDAPLPGGAELGDDPYQVTAQFADVLDLVPQASVKVNDVPVGRIDRIELSRDNAIALVTMRVNGDVRLPADALAQLRQSSLLGEKFVELSAPPAGTSADRLSNGDVIPVERTNRNPQIEEVLGALSMLLNGGGIDQLQTIVAELNRTFAGNEEEIRSLLSNLDTTVTRLDAQRGEIIKAIDGLNRLSATMRAQTGQVNTALDDLAPGLRELEAQRGEMVAMLQSLDRLSTTAVGTINASRDDLLADLKSIDPILRQLADVGTDLPKVLSYMATYPFPEYSMIPLQGDFVNSDVYIDFDLSGLYENFVRSSGPVVPIPGISDSGQSGTDVPAPPGGPQPPPLPIPAPDQGGLFGALLGGGTR